MTVQEPIEYLKQHGFIADEVKDMCIEALVQVEQYRALGTVKELKDALEKQIASKWICYDISERCVCPECEMEWDYMDNCVESFKYCPNCGKRLE